MLPEKISAGIADKIQDTGILKTDGQKGIGSRNKRRDNHPSLDRIEKSLKEQGFDSRRADEEDIKRILAVYYEQNVTSEKFEDFDGARWIIPDD